jgi:cytochrome c-type biogenesis protein CcmH/NrfG
MPGSRPLADLSVDSPKPGDPATPPRPISPEVMKRMLDAARSALFDGNYKAAIAAYEAVLKRDPKNVDALTHMGLIAALAGHSDIGLQTIDRALALDPNFAPALLYRGQILYETKRDVGGAIRSWEKFVAIAPPGEDRERVTKMIAEAKRATPEKGVPEKAAPEKGASEKAAPATAAPAK